MFSRNNENYRFYHISILPWRQEAQSQIWSSSVVTILAQVFDKIISFFSKYRLYFRPLIQLVIQKEVPRERARGCSLLRVRCAQVGTDLPSGEVTRGRRTICLGTGGRGSAPMGTQAASPGDTQEGPAIQTSRLGKDGVSRKAFWRKWCLNRNPRDEAEPEEEGELFCTRGEAQQRPGGRRRVAAVTGGTQKGPRTSLCSKAFSIWVCSRGGRNESTAILNPSRPNPVIPGQSHSSAVLSPCTKRGHARLLQTP